MKGRGRFIRKHGRATEKQNAIRVISPVDRSLQDTSFPCGGAVRVYP